VPPHAIAFPPFASWICVLSPFVLIEAPIMRPPVIEVPQRTSFESADTGRAASATTTTNIARATMNLRFRQGLSEIIVPDATAAPSVRR
jgi:hypothetical protein